jgi:hypothetical protein
MRILSNIVILLLALPFKGRVGWGWCATLCQRIQDHFDDAFDVVEYLVVPESEYSKSSALKMMCPCLVVLEIVGMLATICFYNEFSFQTNEIQDVVTVGVLSSEFASFQLAASQILPKVAFRVSWSIA